MDLIHMFICFDCKNEFHSFNKRQKKCWICGSMDIKYIDSMEDF